MGRPPKLSLEDPNWVLLGTACEWRTQQTGNEEFALRDVGDALREGSLRAKLRSVDDHRLLTKADFAGEVLARWPYGIGWGNLPRDGVVYVWKPDFIFIFRLAETLPQTAPKQPEKPVKTGRPLKHDWIFLTVQASVLIRNNLEIKQADFLEKFSQTLINLDKEVPGIKRPSRPFQTGSGVRKKHRKVRR